MNVNSSLSSPPVSKVLMNMNSSSSSPPVPKALMKVDSSLHAIGLVMDCISPEKVSGHLIVSPTTCQPLKRLHGGVSALIAEGLASMGAFMAASMQQRVAGVHLSIHHLKSAKIGDLVVAEATPLNVAKSIQIWEVRLWKTDPLNSEMKTMIASSRVTVHCTSHFDKDINEIIKTTVSKL